MQPIFKAKDKSEHATAEAAEKRNVLLKAAEAFNKAAEAYERAVGEEFLTADGQHFDMHRFRSYWRVQDRYAQPPSVVEVSVYPHELHVDLDKDRGPLIRWWEPSGREPAYPIKELYADKRNAEAAKLALMERDLANLTADVEAARRLL